MHKQMIVLSLGSLSLHEIQSRQFIHFLLILPEPDIFVELALHSFEANICKHHSIDLIIAIFFVEPQPKAADWHDSFGFLNKSLVVTNIIDGAFYQLLEGFPHCQL